MLLYFTTRDMDSYAWHPYFLVGRKGEKTRREEEGRGRWKEGGKEAGEVVEGMKL